MTKKEKMELLLAKVPEEQKEAFVALLRKADTREARSELFQKYGVTLSEAEKAAIKEAPSNELSDEELDKAAGGCCSCTCDCEQYCSCNHNR